MPLVDGEELLCRGCTQVAAPRTLMLRTPPRGRSRASVFRAKQEAAAKLKAASIPAWAR
jgi:hypothetical protein